MAVKGYTNPVRVAAYLGVTLTADQIDLCNDQLIGAAERWIEKRRGQTWQAAAIVDEEYYSVPGPNLYLRVAPILSVQAVKGRVFLGETETVLVVGTDYEVRDLDKGLIYIPAQGGGVKGDIVIAGLDAYGQGVIYDRIRVSYTPAAALPEDYALAATMLVADWLQTPLGNVRQGVQKETFGDLSVTYSDPAQTIGVPKNIQVLVPKAGWFA